jgi:hypothetical protein
MLARPAAWAGLGLGAASSALPGAGEFLRRAQA